MDLPLGRSADMIALPGGGISAIRLDVALRNELSLWQYRFIQHRLNLIEAQLCFAEPPSPESPRAYRSTPLSFPSASSASPPSSSIVL